MGKGLFYDPPMSHQEMVKRIDATGGWPVNATHLSFAHGRDVHGFECEFFTAFRHNEWWSHVMTADDYYYLKLSERKKLELENAIRDKIANEVTRAVKAAVSSKCNTGVEHA